MARPSKYKSEYCDLLIEHMTKGRSFFTFAAEIGVSRDTLYEWCRAHPEFSDTKKRAEVKALSYWENLGLEGALGNIRGFNATIWIFTMKCRFRKFGWNEDAETDEVETNEPNQALVEMPTKDLIKYYLELREGMSPPSDPLQLVSYTK